MLTAHLPSGYILGKSKINRLQQKTILVAAMFGAVFPDFDMLYFHLVDMGRTHHHEYISHWPLFWAGLCGPLIGIFHARGRSDLRNLTTAFFLGTILHLGLDSIASHVFWLKPFAEGRVGLLVVPASFSNWIWSFVFHWSFLFEVIIWIAAIWIYLSDKENAIEDQ